MLKRVVFTGFFLLCGAFLLWANVNARYGCLEDGAHFILSKLGSSDGAFLALDYKSGYLSLATKDGSTCDGAFPHIFKKFHGKRVVKGKWGKFSCNADFPLGFPLHIKWFVFGDSCGEFFGFLKSKQSPRMFFVAKLDFDQDWISDVGDNCPFVWNADQVDSDSDGVGDACESVSTTTVPVTTTTSTTSTTTTRIPTTTTTSTTSTTTTLITCPGGIIGDPNGMPEIQITDPQPAQIRGIAMNVNTDTQRMVCYAITNHAYIQPDRYAWGADICSDGSWVTNTYPWGRIVCLIVEKSCFEPKSEIFTDPTQEPCVLAWDEFPKRRFVQFAGRILEAKYSGAYQMDPGPNYFSDSEDNIYVDTEGRLHLRIVKDAQGRWTVSELIDTELATYGEYEITVAMPLANLAESEVRAWFIYHYFLTQEADIEISDVLASPNCMQFAMQPYTRPGNIYRFCAERDIDAITFRLVWRPDRMEFAAWRGRTTYPPAPGDVIAEWTYTGPDVLIPDFERVRLNNWLFNGIAPADDQPRDFIIERFTVRPLTISTTTTSSSSTTSSSVRPTTTTSTTSTTTTRIPTTTTTSTTSTTTTSTTTSTTTLSTTTTVPAAPDIAITFLSPYGDLYGIVSGTTRGVDPASFAVAVYIKVRGGWWTKPYFDTPLTVIRADSTWTCDITTGGVDEEATDVTAFLVLSSYIPPDMRGGGVLPDELFTTALDWTSASRTPLS